MECHKCKHRLPVPGSCHSSCSHPANDADDPMARLMAILSSVGMNATLVSATASKIKVELNAHGVAHGWCNFPFDFDPIWVDACEGFEERCPQVLKQVKNDS